ncbi:MAG: YbaB/EbfC family nucleoid-associated protein [Candidatus Gracilibacteria bacterium]|nr:YbaB/EbfC family nucleoid-associated protein [Candidatus Gracilibacteria bacterium]
MDFSKAGEMMKLQQEAMKVKKELENTYIESEVDGLVITFNGEMKAEKVEFETTDLIPGLNSSQKENLEKAILASINKGVTSSQKVAADKMQGVMGAMGMNMPAGGGLPGM